MAIPVKFSDIGKSAKDLLKADVSPFSLEVNSQAVNGLKFTSTIKNSGKDVSGDLKLKHTDAAHGATFTYTFTTDKKLVAKAEVSNAVVKGLNVNAEVSVKSDTKSAGAKFGAGYKQEYVNTNATIDVLNQKFPLTADLVVGYKGFSLGGEITYNAGAAALGNYTVAASYSQPDYAFAVTAKPDAGKVDIDSLSASYFHRINNQVAAGAAVSYKLSSADSTLAIGTDYAVDATSSLKTTLDTNGKVLLQYTQKLKPNLKAIIGSTLQWSGSSSITADLGLSLTLDA